MKKKNREINIFSMSALDLFASAMGAFLLIAVMALPYYLKVDPDLIEQVKKLKTEIVQNETQIATLKEELKKCQEDGAKAFREAQAKIESLTKENDQLKKALAKAKEERQQAQAQLREAKEEVKQARAKANGLQKELSKTFCVVKMQWKSPSPLDVDLHIIDYNGREYSYSKQVYGGIDASLTVDAGDPTKVKRGAEVWVSKELKEGSYTIFYKHYAGNSSATVEGSVFTKSFTKDLPTINLSKGEKKIIAKIKVNFEGKATLETN